MRHTEINDSTVPCYRDSEHCTECDGDFFLAIRIEIEQGAWGVWCRGCGAVFRCKMSRFESNREIGRELYAKVADRHG